MWKYCVAGGLGAVAGAAITYILIKEHYANLAEEEIASVKEAYAIRAEKKQIIKKLDDAKAELVNKNIIANTIIEHTGYDKRSGSSMEPVADDEEMKPFTKEEVGRVVRNVFDEPPTELPNEPFVITPESYANEYREYDENTYIHCALDGAVFDADDNELIDNPYAVLPEDYARHFDDYLRDDQYEANTVYICNPRFGAKFCVIRQEREYEERY